MTGMWLVQLISHYFKCVHCSGFWERGNLFTCPYNDFGGATVNVVMPNKSTIFAKAYSYPDKSKVRTGADFSAMHYLAEALNFKIQ